MNIFAFVFFTSLHLFIIVFCMFYVFIRKSTKYDMLYFTTVCATILSWQLSSNTCILNYWENISWDEKNTYSTKIEGHNIDFLKGYDVIINTTALAFMSYNLYLMMIIYKVPFPIKIILIFSLLNNQYHLYLHKHVETILPELSFLIGYISLAVIVALCS